MIQSIPLAKLVESPRNVRRHSDASADAELKASIASHGLLQNLIVRPALRGKFEVEAGERRRRAMLSLVEDKLLARNHEVTCLVIEDGAGSAIETSLAENFHRLAMNPADEARAFATLVEDGASSEDVARRFGLTVRFVEGRLRLATLAPVVFEALASGEITLDLAKAYGATSDQEIQARVFEQMASAYYAPNPDSVRRMVLTGTVRGNDPRARLVGREAYLEAGGRIERELFDDDASEAWCDVALLETLATKAMEVRAEALAAEQGLAWVRPTLDPYASHDMVEGLVRLPAEPEPLTQTELARLEELDAAYDEHAAVLEDEDASEEAIAAAEAAIETVEQECQDLRNRPPVLAAELRSEAGMVLVLSRDGTPVLQPVFYGENPVARGPDGEADGEAIEVVSSNGVAGPRRATLSKRLVDELAMQRRDVLSLHLAHDPALALDVLIFSLADADALDWRSPPATTLRGSVPGGPIAGFEPGDAPATAALADLRSGLDETWRVGDTASERFALYRGLTDEARSAWLGFVVARALEASLNLAGERRIALHDHLGMVMGIEIARWWRPTAANYFDRVPKALILEALGDVGGPDLAARFASVKKSDLAMSAERVFAGTAITEAEVRDNALAWVPEAMRFAGTGSVDEPGVPEGDEAADIGMSGDEPAAAGDDPHDLVA